MIVQRDDDQPETVRNRLSVYREETQPLEDYYRERGLLVVVNGVGEIEDVHQRIVDALEQAEPSPRAE
jgi:adenylate kinase